MFLHASENRSRVRTLSAPSVLVSDNQTAQFTVGADIPVPVSSAASGVQAPGGRDPLRPDNPAALDRRNHAGHPL